MDVRKANDVAAAHSVRSHLCIIPWAALILHTQRLAGNADNQQKGKVEVELEIKYK